MRRRMISVILASIVAAFACDSGPTGESEHRPRGMRLYVFDCGILEADPARFRLTAEETRAGLLTGRWKLVRTSERPLEQVDVAAFANLTSAGLDNLADDIGDTRDLSASYPQRVKELRSAWHTWNATLVTPLWGPVGRGMNPSARGR